MTKACNPNHHSQPLPIFKKYQWLLILSRGGIALGGILFLGIMGGAWQLWSFIDKDLVPLAQSNLTTTLNRPVKLGEVKELSLTGVKFGASAIPATPTDRDWATVENVEVGFDLLQLLFNRRLKLDVTLVNPDVHIEQDEQGRWITTTITPSGKNGPIKTDLDKLRFRNAELVLVPQHRKVGEQGSRGAGEQGSRRAGEQGSRGENTPASSPSASGVAFSQIYGTAQLLENNQLIKFDLGGQAKSGGTVSIEGDLRPKTQEINLQLVRSQNLLAADVSRIIKLPVELQAGRVQGELKIQNIQLKQKRQNPLIFGNASVQGVQLQVPRMPLPFINSQGNVRFLGTQIQLDNVSTGYGKIPLIANGTIDFKAGYKLVARVNSVNVASARETFKVKLPVPTIGQAKADLQVVGPITNPILSGTVATIKTAKIDKVDFDSVRTQFEFSPVASIITFKNIQGKATVGGDITGAGTIQFVNKIPKLNFNVTAKNVPGDAIASVYDTKPAFQIGTVSGTAQLTGTGENVQTAVQWQAPQATYPGSGETIIAPDKTVSFRNVALDVAGGTVQIAGSWANQRWQAVADASKVQVQRFVNPSQLQNVSLDDARFNGRLILSGTSAPFKIDTIRPDNAKVQLAGGTVAISNIQFGEQSFSAQLVADGVRLGRLLKQAPPSLQGPVAGKLQVSGNTDAFDLKTLHATGEGRLLVGGGTVTASNIQVADGLYKAKLQADDVDLQQVAQLPKQFQGKLTGQFNVAGSVESFQPQAIVATGQARVKIGSGTVTASNIELANGQYQAQLQANNLPLQRLAQVPPQFHGNLTGQFNVAGLAGSFQPQAIKATGQARVNVAGGTVTASNIQVADGRYQAVVDASGVELKRLSQQLRGQFGGKVQLVGTVGTFNISNVRASGQVQLSQGIAGIEQPLTAVVGWDGQKLIVERATSPDLNANGYILAKENGAGIPEITELNLNVQAQNFNLQKLPIQLSKAVALAGQADFGGRISGNARYPNIQGQLRLRELVVNRLSFESVLTGNIELVQGQGLNLDVAGTRDRIALNADAKNRPNSFLVRWQDALASGQSQGDNLAMKVDNFPLAILNLTPPANTHLGMGTIAGFLTGDFQVNQKTFATQGDIAIAKPQLGRIKGDRLMAQFRYGDGQATITNSEFVKGVSRYALAGTFSQTPKGPQIKGKLNVAQGEIQDVLTALQLYELQDVQRGLKQPNYGTAADLDATQSVGFSDQPLLTQLQRFGEIENQLVKEKQQRRDASPVPDLADLNGTFNGEVSIDTASDTGLDVSFNLNGQNFVWGRGDEPKHLYKADQVIAQGRFENGVLRLLPLRIESKNNLIAVTGNIGGKEQSGQLRVINFPVQVLNNFVKLPVDFTGNLNGTAALAGSIDNPQAKGELQITQGTLNQKGVESATASFNYTNGRLDFGSNVMVSGSEPVKIAGSVPYQLPFASVKPDNDNINLDLKVKNEGLAVLNLLTNQVAFEKGEGQIDLTVRGTRQQPIIDGIATVKGATFSSQALPGKLTNMTGEVQFDLDRIIVQNLQGKYNNRGKVEAKGEIPVSSQQTKIDHPLNVTLDQLALNLKELYQGGVSGNLLVTGSALNPMIGGQLQLDDGQVLLAESTKTTKEANSSHKIDNIDVSGVKQVKQQDIPKASNTGTKFNDLQLKLGKNVQITRPPILSFRATGSLTVNGSFSDPIPEGTIRLKDGSVNLFTTRFNLVRSYGHKAIFRANQPRDPELDIQLFAKVLDVIQNTDLNKPNITGLAALETVRVEARIQGAASKLNESLELTSSPVRSETEIVALLGGGIIDSEGRGSDTTLGLINIAGSAVLNNLQEPLNQIGTALGLSELRIFPTILSDTLEAGRNTSSLELAAEAGIDFTRRISVSALKILTTNDPFQWGINYRLNDAIRLRATTNFNDDNRAVVEYQKRF